ncbi:MAG TPA: RNA-binding protein [Bacteroidota bacterium]|jgi:RNA recognition motif-containing protein|nr:RNA-binding protein [Bacteroidota bacterium]
MKIYVGNLSRELTEDEIKQEFIAFGAVDSAKLIKDKYTGESRGFAFVEMPVRAEAEAAVKGLNEKEVGGRKIVVNEARPMSTNKRSHGSGGNNRRGGYRSW